MGIDEVKPAQGPRLHGLACGAMWLLCACGGGGAGGDPSAEGLYLGTGSTSSITVILENGAFWHFTQNPAGLINALFQGDGAIAGDRITIIGGVRHALPNSSDAAEPFTSTIAFDPGTSLSGTLTPAASPPVAIDGEYSTVFERTASLADVAGSYAGVLENSFSGEARPFNMSVGAGGDLQGETTDGSCAFTGTVAPLPDGNVFELITSGGCLPGAGPFNGILFSPYGNEIHLGAVPNTSREYALVFIVNRLSSE